MLVLHRAKLLASNQSVLALGVAPMRVVSRWCRRIVQRLCATDCKRPCLVRAAAPHSAPARTPGVYAQRLCTMQSQPSIHSPSPWGRGLGLGIENKHFFGKTDFFYSLRAAVHKTVARKAVILFCCLHRSYIVAVYCRTVYGKICSYTEGI